MARKTGGSRTRAKSTKASAKRSTGKKAASKRPAGAKPAGGTGGTHTLREDNPWEIDYAGHEPRTNSPLYTQSRALLIKIAQSTTQGSGAMAWYYGDAPWEDHHGGGLWAYGGGWFFVKNYAGIEWASQFCADPAKVELLRQNAVRLYAGFPQTEQQVLALDAKYPFRQILTTPIKDAAGVAQWTDSIFNASVPLPKLRHTGLSPKGHGVHHYPTPVWDIELFKEGDFVLWVTDDQGKPAAVVPVHPRGVAKTDPAYQKNYGKVAVTYATPDSALAKRLATAQSHGNTMVADAGHSLAKQAFKNQ